MNTDTARSLSTTVSRHQLVKIATNKAILDISEALSPIPRRSKIVVILVDYSKQPTLQVKHFVDPDAAKTVAFEIINNTFSETFPKGYVEYKGSPLSKEGKPEARVLYISYDKTRNYPYTIRIDQGEGKLTETGAIKMVSRQNSISMPISVFDMKRAAITVLDYIRAWEIKNFDQLRKENHK